MTNLALPLLAMELAGLCVLVLGMFRLRHRIGLGPLFVTLGVFQPLQVILASSLYVDIGAGLMLSPGSMMFAVSLMAILLIYIREDAAEVRKVVVGVLAANVAMSLVMLLSARQVGLPGVTNLIALPAEIFGAGARVTLVGTLVLVADVIALLLIYGAAVRVFPRHPLLRATVSLTGVLLFDGVAFAFGAFAERPDFGALLYTGLILKLVLAAILSCFLVVYLRFFEPGTGEARAGTPGMRDVFYAFTWRDRFADEEARNRRLQEERAQMFERITDGFVALDRDWNYTYVNPRAAELIGHPADELIGRNLFDVFPDAVGSPFDLAYRRAMDTQQPVSFEAHYPAWDRWFESHVYPAPDGLTMYFHDVTARIVHQREMVKRATRDDLTGLLSRNGMRDAIDDTLRAPHAPGEHFGVIAFNLDRLHQVNDTLGYAAGDQVLRSAAERLGTIADAHACALARIGADGFLMATGWTPRLEHVDDIARLASDALARQYTVEGQSVHLTNSAGIAWFPEAGADASSLIKNADLAVNVAKQQGRNRIVAHSAARATQVAERIALISEIRDARDRGELSLAYQPLVSANGALAGAEALLRWHSATRGQVSPGVFIPVAEDAGLIVDLGRWVLAAGLEQVRQWQADGAECVPLSVNVSAAQLERAEFVAEVREALRASGVPARLLKLEITESVFLHDAAAAVNLLQQLRELGVRISLDDFGTGYSNLGNLRRLPLDEIKIDRSFVHGLPGDVFSATLCRVIVAMSGMLGFDVVAEGVEDEAQAAFLREAGCDTLQGYLFARPMPGVEMRRWLAPRAAA